MNQFNLSNFFNKFRNNYQQNNGIMQGGGTNATSSAERAFQTAQNLLNQQGSIAQYNASHSMNKSILNNLKMNNLANIDRSVYLRDLMNLPKDIEQVLVILQNNTNNPKELTKLLTTNINLANLSEVLQKNGKEAMGKLISAMAEASKQGINDTSQLKDAIKFVNNSLSVASGENPTQTLKNFMLLYLPWLPLQEGVDFELEFEESGESGEKSETVLTIMISTRNYGNVRIMLILNGINSIDIFINCSEKFPKEELLKRINQENKNHSIQSNVMFEQKEMKHNENPTRQAKISMSNLTEVNPFLLLTANALIKHTIELDNKTG